MKILHIIYDDPKNPWLGGGGAIRTKEINEFLSKNHEVTVITGNFPGVQKTESVNNICYKRIGSKLNYVLSRITYALLAGLYIKKTPHDLLIEDFSGHSPTFSTLFTKKPTIAILQNYFGKNSFKKLLLAGIIPFLYEKMFIHHFDGVVTVSNAVLKHWVGDSFQKKVAFIPQGINPAKYQNRATSEKILLFVGRLDFVQKGLDILLASLKLISDLKIPLVIVGGGDQKRLSALIAKNDVGDLVVYKGRVSHEETINFFAQSYFLCLPSRYEGWPLVCVESYALGKPVLGTDIPGLRDVVIPGETGILVPGDNPAAYAEQMRNLLENPGLRHKLGAQAYQSSKNFEWEKLAVKQETFYKEMVGYGR